MQPYAAATIAAEAQTPKGRYLKPVRVLIADRPWQLLRTVDGIGFRSDDSAGHSGDMRVLKRLQQKTQPILIWDGIVVYVGDDIGIAFGQSAIARMASACSGSYSGIARREP